MGIAEDVLTTRILPLIREVAREEKLPLIDLHEPLRSAAALFPDLIHPNPDGARRIAEIVYGEVMLAVVPGAKSLDPAGNTAVIPAPRLELDCYNWWQRHAEELDLHGRIDPEIVLIGDSITHFWGGVPEQPDRRNGPEAWRKTFGSRAVVNLGFGWDRTQNALWRIDHGELAGYRPKLVVINLGTNNLAGTENSRPNTPEEIADGVVAVCARVQATCPGAQIAVMGVFPRGRTADEPVRTSVSAVNAELAKQLAGRAGVRFLDIGREFLAADGSIPETLMPDALHPSEQGYEIWGNALAHAGLLP
jgi:lysophospholipase L1-like esterase